MELAILLRPKLLSVRPKGVGNRRQVVRLLLFSALGFAFALGIFFLSKWFLNQCLAIDIIGEMVTKKLLSIMFMTFFFILIFSNVITSLTTFYLADDLELVLSMPIRFESFFWARYLEMSFHSSWAILSFFLPIMAAYGWVFSAPWGFYPAAVAIMFLFLFPPAAIGVTVTSVLVRLFPAHRLREMLTLVGILTFILLYLLTRFMEPERFLNPEGFGTMVEFMAKFNAPEFVLLPSYWAAESMFAALKGISLQARFPISLLASAAGLSFAASLLLYGMHHNGFSKAREGRKAGFSRTRFIDSLVSFAGRPFKRLPRTLLIKDLKIFLRQPSQWTQLLLLLALVIVYIYNFKHFRTIASTGLLTQWGLYFINIGLSGFVVASVGIRFVFPAVSLEGRSFYIVRTAPVRMRDFLMAKFFVYLLPLAVLGVLMTAVSNLVIATEFKFFVVSTLITLLCTVIVTGLGVGAGAIFPKFNAENPATIASSYGGVIYMILSMTAVGILVALTVWPTWYLRHPAQYYRSVSTAWWVIGTHGLLIVLLCFLCTVVPLKLGEKALESRE
jgi:ABC-2 type transport system permease protein